MGWMRNLLSRFRDLLAIVMGLLILGYGMTFLVRASGAAPGGPLTLTAGSSSGQRHQVALMLAEESRSRGQEVTVVETAGSEEALDRVNAGLLDAALVQGGLGLGARGNIRQVAGLHVEPLHLLVKSEIFPEVSRRLAALKGKVVNLGEPGSGTNTLVREVLRFVGMTPAGPAGPGDFTPSTLGYPALMAEPDRSKLPDAVFMVMSLPSPVARHLIGRQGYRVVPLDFAEGFALDALAPHREAEDRVKKGFVHEAAIPAYTYGVEPPVPERSVHTLGTRLLLIAREDAPPEAVAKLLGTIFESPFVQVSRPPLDPRLLDLPPELPIHAGTAEYLSRRKPLIAADFVDYSEKVLAITATVLSGLFFIGQGARNWGARRRELQLRHYLAEVSRIERQTSELERSASPDLDKLLQLQESLNSLKGDALEKFATGQLLDEQLLTGFLTLVNDSRNQLTRLILHRRETQARRTSI